ncbi:ABC transporter permease [Chelatococcus sp. SYSU_G07232]|uniref:ABC transporter permease n=1 Tax=Chelatococcus albus TaxID=3047466 RepID=A0ABT7AL66_9HYPH|nr:ABC transporter permease [Chelatococcus sp. SYSU_G07232]MDJ1159805.1 ABC transporter permease [Chelatococcus sp. SYSU_G07232]
MSLTDILGLFLNLDVLERYGWRMLNGLGVTIELVAISVPLGLVLGFGLALARMSGKPVLSPLVRGYSSFFRGTPLLCQLFLVYYGAGQIREPLEAVGLWGFFREAFFCAAFTFTLNTAAYQGEILRGAIQSLPRGQKEAAAALGLGWYRTMRHVIMPQAMAVALRPLGNELILMIKASSIASLVTVFDLMGATRFAFARTFDLQVYLYAAVMYLVLVETIRRVWDVFERRLTRHLTHA